MTVAISTVSQPINITLGLPSQHLGERGWREGRMGGRMKKKTTRFRCWNRGRAACRSNADKKKKKEAVLSDTQEKKNTKKYHVFPSKACTTTHSGS